MLETKIIVSFVAIFLMEVAIFIEVPIRGHRIRYRCGV